MSELEIHTNGHKTIPVTNEDGVFMIDELIAPLIDKIWKLGIKTSASCEGFVYSWINFTSIHEARKFMSRITFPITRWHSRAFRIIDCDDSKIVKGYKCVFVGKEFDITIGDDDIELLTISISFPRTHIEDILECF